MRRNANFLLRQVADSQVLVPVGEASRKFPGMIRLNETGCFLWEKLEQEQTVQSLTEALLVRYEVSVQQAQADVEAFLARIRPTGALVD